MVRLRTGKKVVIKNNKKDFKSGKLNLKGCEDLFLNNTTKMIYNFR